MPRKAPNTVIPAILKRRRDPAAPPARERTRMSQEDRDLINQLFEGATLSRDEMARVAAITVLELTPEIVRTLYGANPDANDLTDALLSKIEAIESSATADQTGAEIVDLLEQLQGALRLDASAIRNLLLDYSDLTGLPTLGTAAATDATDYAAAAHNHAISEVTGLQTALGDASGGKFVDGTDAADAVYPLGKVAVGTDTPTAKLHVTGSDGAEVVQKVVGAAGQTANLAEWRDAGGTLIAAITAIGQLLAYGKGGSVSCVAIGQDALKVNIKPNNTAVGAFSLSANTTGSNNTAFGTACLRKNVTGIRNMAVGTSALQDNVSGNYNAAIGTNCLVRNISGSSNTANGDSSLFSNTTGDRNIASGFGALQANVTGSGNLGLGTGAGRSASDNVNNSTGEDSIFIGGNTKPQSNNQVNQIVIGDSAVGEGSNSVVLGNDDVVKTVLKGKVQATSINFSGLPTATTGLASGDVWNDSGTLKIIS